MQKNDFDLIVLGAGSGGIASALRAAEHGAKVAIIEPNHLGGTCLNLGSIPKKMMFHAANIAETFNKSVDYGFSLQPIKLDWHKLVNRRNHYIEQLRGQYSNQLKAHQITHIKGLGTFHDHRSVMVNDKKYTATHIIIATGSEPSLPNINGIQHCIDSDGFFSLTKQPYKVAVIGSGYIGVELAGLLHALGSEVHLLMRGEKPLSRFDATLGETLLDIMKRKGILIHPNHQAQTIELHSDGKKSIHCHHNSSIDDIDVIIAAVGRTARIASLNLHQLHINTNEHGFIEVDPYQNTSVDGIYAIGDVTNAPALTPVAITAGRRLADRLFSQQPHLVGIHYEQIGSVIFSHPPIATLGLSEQEAIKRHGAEHIKIYQTRINPMLDTFSEEKTPTVIKLITLGDTERIIGLHIIGNNADEMLQGFGVAISMGACKKDFDNTIAIHPTNASSILNLY